MIQKATQPAGFQSGKLAALLIVVSSMMLVACDSGGETCVNGFCQEGNCRLSKDPENDTDVRVHLTNAQDVEGISVDITAPGESCTIDELPVTVGGNLELGQAVLELSIGDLVRFEARSPSGSVTHSCRTTAEAFDDPESAFVTVLITQGIITCDSGFQEP